MAYGRILPPDVLAAPRKGCVNLHASILPKYRGAAPITWAIVLGERETGISLMQMDEGMDTGPVFSVRRVPIASEMNAADLSAALAEAAAEVVRDDLPRVLAGELVASPQPVEGVSHARMLEKQDGVVSFAKPARAVLDHVRGMNPWPGAQTSVEQKGQPRTLKLLRLAPSDREVAGPPGRATVDGERVFVRCEDAAVEVISAQLEGKRPQPAAELVRGRALADGTTLGEA